jgi:hypothetical protein
MHGVAEDAGMDGVAEDVAIAQNSIEQHLSRLEEAGTLDTTHVLQYSTWGPILLSPRILEICRFLRSVEAGGGSSNSGSGASLTYARSLDGRGLILPKTVETCWEQMSKVCANEHHKEPCNVN